MLQIHQPLSRKLRTYSVLALMGIGIPLMVYGMTVAPKYEKVSAAGDTRTLADISMMQEMSPGICANTAVGVEKTLTDSRDGKPYTVAKLKDGNCWMTSNLALDLSVAEIATSAESDNLSANWPTEALPNRFDTASTNAWEDTSTLAEFSKAPVKVYSTNPGDGNGYQSAYGYYYSWCAATGGTCSAASSEGVDASGSICPKGWKLPKGGTDPTTNDFAVLMTKDGASLPNPLVAGNTYVSWSSNLDGTVPAIMTLGGTKWYRAGYVYSNGLSYPGSGAYYWSRTASSSTNAYDLGLNSSGNLYPALNGNRYVGLSVRCVAYGEIRSLDANVNVSVAPTIMIDATAAGMKSDVEASKVATGTIEARITANTPYRVLLSSSATNPGNKTTMYRRTDSMEEGSIPTYDTTSSDNIPASSNVVPNTNAWGIDNSCNKDGSNLAYLPITTSETEYCNTTSIDETTRATIHKFGIGISVSPSLSSGTYETSVTVTGVGS